jgi:hypothetical protein
VTFWRKLIAPNENVAKRLLSFVLYNVANTHGEETRHLDRREIAAILKFCFAETDEVRGFGVEMLPEELLIELKSFAAGKLKRKELEECCDRIASNTAAIEILAHEIQQHWNHKLN